MTKTHRSGTPRFRRVARVAAALPLVGFVSADVIGPAAAASGNAAVSWEEERARVVEHFERVVAELAVRRAPQSADRSGQPPADRAAEYARVVEHFERVLKERPDPAAPQIGNGVQRDPAAAGDRSGAVMALLLESTEPRETTDAAVPPATGGDPARTTGSAAENETVEMLQSALEARDAVIADLLRRVEQLEQRTVLSDVQLDQAVGGAGPVSLVPHPVAAASVPATPLVALPDSVEPNASTGGPSPAAEVQVAQAQGTEAGEEAAGEEAAAAPAASAPGQFEVDEGLIDRALERTLVQEGALLLPLGQAEVEPSFQYTRRENKFPTVVNGQFLGEQKVRRNEFQIDAALRVGLPFDSQIEVNVPYNIVDQSNSNTVGGVTQNSNSDTGHGLGDVSVGLAKTLLQEGAGWWPDLIARVTYDSDSGDTSDNGVFLGGGFNEITGSLSAVKRQDPLAFVGNFSYTKTFENDDIEPGDEVGFSIGTVLAASPETSLSFFFNQTFADDTKVDGDKIGGTDQVIGTFSIGAATTLGSNVLLSVTGEIGLTDDAPDYAIGVALPIRFNLPTL